MNKLKNIKVENILAVLVIYLLTFPNLEPNYSIGLDSSYTWALNYLFSNNFHVLKELIYPYGPLAFLKLPLTEGNNFEYYLLFYTLIKLWFTFLFIYLVRKTNPEQKILSYFIVTILLLLFDIDNLMIGISFINCFLFLQNKKFFNIIMAGSIAFIGICIKSSIGISAFSIIVVALLIDLFQNRNYKNSLKYVGIELITVLLLGFLIFQNFGLLFHYCINIFKLSFSYSSALSLFPPNNWILLGSFIFSILITPFIVKEKNTRIAFLLFAPVLFAMWKHAMTREDFSHSAILLTFLFLFWGINIAISKEKIKLLLFLTVFNISLFYINITNTWDYKPVKLEINGINNFVNTVINFKEFKEKNHKISHDNIQPNVLDLSVKELIKNSTVDSYPWELSYFSANNFNWKARRTLQSGSYSRWLDGIIAQDFNRENGADYIIWHYVGDKWNGNFGSIDERYLLNDNPMTIFNILNFYSIKLKTSNYLLLKKNNKNNFLKVENEKTQTTQWNKWIDIKTKDAEILRIKIFSKSSFIGKIKNFLYKTEAYYIDYMFEDGKVLSYRFIPENAKDGIWINPFVRFPESNQEESRVSKIRFRCNYSLFNEENFDYQFEKTAIDTLQFPTNSKMNCANYLFLKTKPFNNFLLFKTYNDFEQQDNNKKSGIAISDKFFYSGKYSNRIDPKGFSYTVKIDLDTLWNKIDTIYNKILIESDLKYLNINSEANHIITLSNSENDFWKAIKLEKNQDKNAWNYSYQCAVINRKQKNKGILNIYIWNNGKNNIFIDEMRVTIKPI